MPHFRYTERYDLAQSRIEELKASSSSSDDFKQKVRELADKTYGKENYEVYIDVLTDMNELALAHQFVKRMKSMGHNAPSTEFNETEFEEPTVVQPEEPAAMVQPDGEEEEEDDYYEDAPEEEEVYQEKKFLKFDEFVKVYEANKNKK